MDIITNEESDVLLARYADWVELSDGNKTYYIKRASNYILLMWTCVNIDFSDLTLVPDEIKEACSLYAYADFNGNLFGDVTTNNDTEQRKIKSYYRKGLSGAEKTEYFQGMSTNGSLRSSLGYPDMLMSKYCTLISRSVDLERV